jgi:mannose-6-phosphate isomerase-like protein (cupin superfamily)
MNHIMILRRWQHSEHLRHIDEGEWLPMYAPDGSVLVGIDGKRGVRGLKDDGSHIGADFIRMQPGAQFALHVHDGDHEIYFITGDGFVHIDGKDIPVTAGHLIHIPGEYPHGIWVGHDVTAPLIFVPAGHPHHPVHAPDRMRLV